MTNTPTPETPVTIGGPEDCPNEEVPYGLINWVDGDFTDEDPADEWEYDWEDYTYENIRRQAESYRYETRDEFRYEGY